MRVTMATIASFAAFLLIGTSAWADASALSFKGSKALAEVKSGVLKNTLRLGDRSQAPYSYKVGAVVALVNSDSTEDKRSFDAQIAANTYGKVEITSLRVAKFETLTAGEKKQVTDFYSADKIVDAKGVVSVIGLKFK